jgi:hypothetical protein
MEGRVSAGLEVIHEGKLLADPAFSRRSGRDKI